MIWSRSTSPASIVARFFAIAIVVAWTLVPAICGGEFEAEHSHAQVAGHDDAAGHAHADTQHHKDDLSSCCRSLADAKFLTAVPTGFSPSKAILIGVVASATAAKDWPALESAPVLAPTGPPRIRSSRYISYSPLAPPVRTA